jgi:hypothetical protein
MASAASSSGSNSDSVVSARNVSATVTSCGGRDVIRTGSPARIGPGEITRR